MIVYENSKVVAIATGLQRKSVNPKTGPVVQIWILPTALNPVEAALRGDDDVVCKDCPLRPALEGGCYVNLGQAALAIWKSWCRGGYPPFDVEAFRDKFVRFGAYGEPVLIPLSKVVEITAVASGWTGYTHQWRKYRYEQYRRYFMASCSGDDFPEAQALGWRTFAVSRASIPGAIICPASQERGFKLDCVHCGLCNGTSGRTARSIQIAPHGARRGKIK